MSKYFKRNKIKAHIALSGLSRSIVKNQLNPEVLVIGTQDKSVQKIILECYLTYIVNKSPIFMSQKLQKQQRYY